jgi:ABC-2 type transport system permease protein
MTAIGATLRQELVGLGGIVERNVYLTKRYFLWDVAFMVWTIANTLTIVFIARAVGLAPAAENELATSLLVGAVIWAFLGIIFEFVTETVAWERWEGTIEYTFMAPLSRPAHLLGMGAFAVLYGVVRTVALFGLVALTLGVQFHNPDFVTATVVLAVSSVSFVGIGMMTAVLPLVSPEKGTQLGFIAQGLLLVISGVYYPVSVLPQWMQWLSVVSPATYTLEGARRAILDGASVSAVWDDLWPLILIGAIAVPLGLFVFSRGERYAKRHGRLKRSG